MDISETIKGILQGWVGDSIKWALLVGVPVMIGWARTKDWSWATPVTYSLVTLAALYIILFSGLNLRNQESPGALEVNIRNWSYGFGHSVRKDEAMPEENFRLLLNTSMPQLTLLIYQKKKLERYVNFYTRFDMQKSARDKFESLPESKREDLISELKIDFARATVQYKIEPSFLAISCSISVPVEGFSEAKFLEAITTMQAMQIIMFERIRLYFANN